MRGRNSAGPLRPPRRHLQRTSPRNRFRSSSRSCHATRITDRPIRAIDVGGYRVGVFAVFRPKDAPQQAIYHDTNMTEILYILEGSATLITGGTIPDARPPHAPRRQLQRHKIEGGTSRHVVPGDVIITPGRTPHWWAEPGERHVVSGLQAGSGWEVVATEVASCSLILSRVAGFFRCCAASSVSL